MEGYGDFESCAAADTPVRNASPHAGPITQAVVCIVHPSDTSPYGKVSGMYGYLSTGHPTPSLERIRIACIAGRVCRATLTTLLMDNGESRLCPHSADDEKRQNPVEENDEKRREKHNAAT
jgi:hypothetical protein